MTTLDDAHRLGVEYEARLTYVIVGECWYASSLDQVDRSSIEITALVPGNGCLWHFGLFEHETDKGGDDIPGAPAENTLRLEIFADGFAAFAEIPGFFRNLARYQPTSIAEVRATLDRMGAADLTPRVNPSTVTGEDS